MLKICKTSLELLKDRKQLDMVEELIKGELNSIYNKRLSVAYKKYLPNFNPKEPTKFIIMIDANNLYGGIMENFSLSFNDFELLDQQWETKLEPHFLQNVLETTDDSDFGYIMEVDLSYPDALHDPHSDFP